ncbi:MAG: HAD family phosphatase [Candidatus Sumerlaeota bacterium]|nr:HAD family phosphatase [Candidatus Sumerlaeota bacterium]
MPQKKAMPDFLSDDDNPTRLKSAAEKLFRTGYNGVREILGTRDGKVEFIRFANGEALAHVRSQMGYPAIYPLHPVRIEKPLKAVLMDLDGTSVHSEPFWIWIIEQTTARLLGNPKFTLEESDQPHVSGHSVSEHLKYCIEKYCPGKKVEEARKYYFEITHCEMKAILKGTGRVDAFVPAPGLKDFLLALKGKGIKIGLVTSGLYEKAWPEIWAAFQTLKMGDPRDFYDAIITAGFALRKGEVGTLGELEPKPHPWLYAETARVGLGIDFSERACVVGMEDSGAGVVSIRLAGFACIGIGGGNLRKSGTAGLCSHVCKDLHSALKRLI